MIIGKKKNNLFNILYIDHDIMTIMRKENCIFNLKRNILAVFRFYYIGLFIENLIKIWEHTSVLLLII